MSSHDENDPSALQARDEPESDPLVKTLAQALAHPPPPRRPLLPQIQHRIHQRTRGRYYRPKRIALRDPITWALIVGVALALIAIAAFLVLSPLFAN